MKPGLLALGARIIAIQADSKIPVGPWKTESLKCVPSGNVAIVCDSNFTFIDVEGPGKSVNGLPHWEQICKMYGGHPMAPTVRTPSGGLCIIFRGQKSPHCDLSGTYGLELRTGMHYNLMPPSVVNGTAYEWEISIEDVLESEGEIPELPDWIADFFASCRPVEIEARSQAYELDEFAKYYIELNLHRLDADMSYPQWWEVMAICHRAGLKQDFIEWSRTAKTKWKDDTQDFIERQWRVLSKRSPDKTVGLTRFIDFLTKKNSEVFDTSESMKYPVHETTTKESCVDCSGLLFRIVESFGSQVQKPYMYRHLVGLSVLGTLAQRRIKSAKGLPANFHMLSSPTMSLKTVMSQAALDLVRQVRSEMVMNKPASSQALQRLFYAEPSRFLCLDESIQTLVEVAKEQRGKNPVQTEMFNLMLEYFGNPKVVLGQENKASENSIRQTLSPRLSVICMGVPARLEELVSLPQFIQSGLASRFALWEGERVEEDCDSWLERDSNGVEWDPELVQDLKRHYGETYHASSSDHPLLIPMWLGEGCKGQIKPFYEECYERAKGDEQRGSIWTRMVERAAWYASLHAWGCKREEVTPEDFEYGIALCRYHMSVWDKYLGHYEENESEALYEAILAIVKKHGSATKSKITVAFNRRMKKRWSSSERDGALRDLVESGDLLKLVAKVRGQNVVTYCVPLLTPPKSV